MPVPHVSGPRDGDRGRDQAGGETGRDSPGFRVRGRPPLNFGSRFIGENRGKNRARSSKSGCVRGEIGICPRIAAVVVQQYRNRRYRHRRRSWTEIAPSPPSAFFLKRIRLTSLRPGPDRGRRGPRGATTLIGDHFIRNILFLTRTSLWPGARKKFV